MFKRIQNTAHNAKIKAFAAINSIRQDNRGLSGVVVAILLILVAVLAVAIIWVFLGGYLEQIWEQITSKEIA